MPLYEYRCDACEHQFEVIQSFSAKPIRKCEKCGGRVQKLISRAGFVLKGGGWYKTDYAPSSAPSKEPAAAGADASEKPAATSAEAKPEPKPAPAAAPGKKAKASKA